MRSRSTPPVPPAPPKQRGAARATPKMAPGAPTTGRRTRRTQAVPAGAPEEASLPTAHPAPVVLAPEELYRHEKARRVGKLDNDVMAEAKRMLEEMLAESSKRGGTVKGGRRAARPKSTDPVDAMNLEQFDGLDAPDGETDER